MEDTLTFKATTFYKRTLKAKAGGKIVKWK